MQKFGPRNPPAAACWPFALQSRAGSACEASHSPNDLGSTCRVHTPLTGPLQARTDATLYHDTLGLLTSSVTAEVGARLGRPPCACLDSAARLAPATCRPPMLLCMQALLPL